MNPYKPYKVKNKFIIKLNNKKLDVEFLKMEKRAHCYYNDMHSYIEKNKHLKVTVKFLLLYSILSTLCCLILFFDF